MRIGFYRDLAVGCDRTGSETWGKPADFMAGAEVGAPPDILNPCGQNWGLPPFNPIALRRHGYRPFIELVRANMRHAGGLRIDVARHVHKMAGAGIRAAQLVGIGLGALGPVRRLDGMNIKVNSAGMIGITRQMTP
jgi:hypothetical protein